MSSARKKSSSTHSSWWHETYCSLLDSLQSCGGLVAPSSRNQNPSISMLRGQVDSTLTCPTKRPRSVTVPRGSNSTPIHPTFAHQYRHEQKMYGLDRIARSLYLHLTILTLMLLHGSGVHGVITLCSRLRIMRTFLTPKESARKLW